MRPFLSVCMIVKDEEKVLRRCLESIHGIADEIIVADTGSVDRTKEIALEFTDKVFDYKWENDFSKARNFAASKATGEWIFVIDADEFVDRENFLKFKEKLQKNPPENNILAVQIVNFLGENGNNTAFNYHDRLYRNDGSIYYYRSIHELLKHKDSQEKSGIVDFQIFHSGYMENVIQEKNKSKRNLTLLKNKKEKEAIDYFFIGNEYDRLGDLNNAIKNYKIAYQLKDSIYQEWVNKLLIRLIIALCNANKQSEALEIIHSCEEIFPHLVDFKFIKGRIYFNQGNYTKAKIIFEEIINKKNELKANTSHDFLEYLPCKILGEIYEEEHKVQLAIQHYSRALSINDADDNLWSKLITLLAKYSSLENISEFLNNNLLTKKNITPQRVLKILFNVPDLNVQKLTRSLLDEPQLSPNENEALYIKNLILDGNLIEVRKLIDEKSKEEIYSLLNTNGILSITDFIILSLETKKTDYQKLLYEINFNPSITNLLKLIFNRSHKKISAIEEEIFILVFRQAIVLGLDHVIYHLNNKVKYLSGKTKKIIVKINREISSKDFKKSSQKSIFENSNNNINELKNQLEMLISNLQYNEALALVDEAIKLEPKDADLYSIKSVILISLEKFDNAEEVLNKGLAINPNHVDCLYNKAFVYEQKNQIGKAKELYEKILEITKEKELIFEIKHKLEKLESGKRKKILYLGWLGYNNIGDDVLYELFEKMFHKYKTISEEVQIEPLNSSINQEMDLSNYDLIVLGGGSLFNIPQLIDICSKAIKQNIPVVSWGTGIDGFYKNNHIQSVATNHQLKDLYEQFKYISIRGPFTKNALLNIGVKNNIDEIGDPALIYADETLGERTYQNRRNKKILINWGTSYNNIFGQNEETVEDELVGIAKSLIEKGYLITIYPIWSEDIKPVKRLWKKINDKNCEAITEVYDAETLQKLISESYMTINLKLHANILSASANVPFISIAYRGKCFDFAKTVDCLEYVIPTDEVDKKKLLQRVESIEKNYDLIEKRFKLAKSKYHPKVIKSIEIIANLLSEGQS